MMKGVHKLKPGEMLILDLATARSRLVEYWDIPDNPVLVRSDIEWVDEVEHKIVDSVRAQMVSDVDDCYPHSASDSGLFYGCLS